MKIGKIIWIAFIVFFATQSVKAQTKKITIPVSGNCSMCKNAIEKAATSAGASIATWDTKTKMLSLQYDEKNTDINKMQEAIAKKGYDTKDIKGNDEAYQKLDDCCKYERKKTHNN